MNKEKKLLLRDIVILVLLASVAGGGYLLYVQHQWIGYTAPESGLSLRVPKQFTLTDGKHEAGTSTVAEWLLSQKSDQQAHVSILKEVGIQGAAALSHSEPLTLLETSGPKRLATQFHGFAQTDLSEQTNSGKKAAEIDFSYDGPNGSKVRQRFLMILRDPNTALYLSFEARADLFDRMNRDYFDPMIKSLQIH